MPFPIPDQDVVEDSKYDDVARIIDAGLMRGTVYVHCWGGVGRTGTVIGCRLADQGLSFPDVMSRLTELRARSSKATCDGISGAGRWAFELFARSLVNRLITSRWLSP